MQHDTTEIDRYVRQICFTPLGEAGQRQLVEARVLLCGCGALGTVLANTLVRAGVGYLRIVDRDFVETNNLQRQVLFDESDVNDRLPKAIAAQKKLQAINSQVTVEAVVADMDYTNAAAWAEDVDLLLDGTDNFQTRFLLNDLSLKSGIPWVYGGCIGAEGQTMTILPGETACLSCVMPEAPPPGTTPTCDTAGILGPIVNIVASLQAVEAIKILSGNRKAISRSLTVIDLWENRIRQIELGKLRERGDCPTCCQRNFPWLSGERFDRTAVLCGRNAVQLRPAQAESIALETLAERLSSVGEVSVNPFLLRLETGPYVLTVFPDGRTIVGGTDDIAEARTVRAKYLGN